VVTMDCDEQHEPHLIPALLGSLRGHDIVSGSRYLPASERGQRAPVERERINREISAMLRAKTGYAISDAFCGFKAYRVAALRRLGLDEPSYAMPLQLWIQAACAGLRLRELAVGRIYPSLGRSFPGLLDDPSTRRRHYIHTIQREVRRCLSLSSS